MGSLLPSYLFQRNQIWYFRQRVPVELITVFGRKEFKTSLKTRDVTVAKRRAISIASRLWSQFDLFQSEMMKKDNDAFVELMSNWFSRFRKAHNLKIDGKKQDFHSFRHNVSDFFKQQDIPDTQAAAIIGHAEQTITYGRYGKDLQASKLVDLTDKLDFSNHIRQVKPWIT